MQRDRKVIISKNRIYLVAHHLKLKKIKTEEVTREWVLQSYLSKGKVSDFQLPNTPIKVNFSVHPNQLKVTQAVQLTISEKGQNLPYAEINLREKVQLINKYYILKLMIKDKLNLNFQKLENI